MLRWAFLMMAVCVTNKAHAQIELLLAVGWTKPPYVIQHNGSGFEMDFIKAVMADAGYSVKPVYVPFGRSSQILFDGEVDGAFTQSHNIASVAPLLSEPYISYQNVAITLSDADIELGSVDELREYSVVAFQRAEDILGEAYADAINQSPVYTELANQEQQVQMLLEGRMDVAIMDVNIFNYLAKKWLLKPLNEVDVHYLFPATSYAMGLKDGKVREAFNRALERFKASERYRQLIQQYQFIQPGGPQPKQNRLWDFGL
ncbi:substrate-binding periplasmic protein [Saliniradius amylolyticus]|nr:transporter substrate-binding domain-containing protein [Saliniradius amylolyticus]